MASDCQTSREASLQNSWEIMNRGLFPAIWSWEEEMGLGADRQVTGTQGSYGEELSVWGMCSRGLPWSSRPHGCSKIMSWLVSSALLQPRRTAQVFHGWVRNTGPGQWSKVRPAKRNGNVQPATLRNDGPFKTRVAAAAWRKLASATTHLLPEQRGPSLQGPGGDTFMSNQFAKQLRKGKSCPS